MKPEELCIGDWVRRRWTCIDIWREVVRNFQITEIRKNGKTLYAWGKGGNMGMVEKLEPIPLTAEILEKNGFSRNGLDIALFDRKGGDDFVGASNLQCVHELQHCLKLVGIEKEITI